MKKNRIGNALYNLDRTIASAIWGTAQETISSEVGRIAIGAGKPDGGRGITICERWSVFSNFLQDMGRKPSPRHSLDRWPDNDGNYEPDNCRWATAKEQRNNQRPYEFTAARRKQLEDARQKHWHRVDDGKEQ